MNIKVIAVLTIGGLLGSSSHLFAESKVSPEERHRPALFAKIKDVAWDDVLNIRTKPDYRSAKVGEVAPSQDAQVGVDYCLANGISTWCMIFDPNNINSFEAGWVNSTFLDLEYSGNNSGYVKIAQKINNCFYAVKCEVRIGKEVCLVADYDALDVEGDTIKKNKFRWIDREKLVASSNFDAAADDAEGYCTNGMMLEGFLQEHPDFVWF